MHEERDQLEDEVKDLVKENKEMKEEMDKLRVVAVRQQRYLEQVDAAQRAKNILIRGVPAGGWMSKQSDEEKIRAVFSAINCDDVTNFTARRVGKQEENKVQPILVEMSSNQVRNRIVKCSAALRGAEKEELRKVRIKKDQHPAIAREWWRLFQAEKAAQEDPDNADAEIVLDRDARQLLRNGIPIDRFNPDF